MSEISKQMITMSEVAIVQSTPSLNEHLHRLNNRSQPKLKKDPELFLFSVDSLLSQEEATYILSPFSVQKERGETAYSEPLLINGITWRLKVYPNGNGSVKGTYMSVFVEMVKGWGNEVGSYEYRVEMINHRDHKKIITREFVSEFESSVSWGYNRFFKQDWLAKEGYLDTEKDQVILKYYISPSNECQLINDQKKHIKYLEIGNNSLKHESNELRVQLKDQLEKRLKSVDELVISEDMEFEPRDCEENRGSMNGQQIEKMLSLGAGSGNIDNLEKYEEEIMRLKQTPNELTVERGNDDFMSKEDLNNSKSEDQPENEKMINQDGNDTRDLQQNIVDCENQES